ncbi:ANTAR domain-containing response regulator [Pseudogulbenkiania sp. MAI-1]|uniref:ANTAR domain-containing response regulator n=1 Tax=Pseudogulbenkiania sp. MAI-1 TaxID=990370 RepID=UPI000A03C34A|nr:ANTAR domain-containing protein [Pseudogulbenkiania sp. MAI-1]
MTVLTVMLVNDGSGKAAALKEALTQAGVRVIAEVEVSLRLGEMIDSIRPDIVLIDSDAPSRDMLEHVCVVSAHSERPVVMFTDDTRRDTIRAALAAGVAAYVVGDVVPERIQPLLEVAIERYSLDKERREELDDMRQRLADRQVVEKAKGLLMQMKGIGEDEAYRQLRERAMKSQKKLGDVAREVVELANWLKG